MNVKMLLLLLSGLLIVSQGVIRYSKLKADLEVERAEHETTRAECDMWRAIAEQLRSQLDAQAENTRRCLEREKNAQTAADERAAILASSQPRQRTAEEKEKVVDDATRRSAVLRLNRPL